MKMGVDLDGVIGDILTPTIKCINSKYKLNLKKEDVTCYDISKCTSLTKEQVRDIFRDFGDLGYFKDMKLLPHAKAGMDYLKDNEISIVTYRDFYKGIEDDTINWLKRKGVKYKDIFFTNKKGEISKNLNLELFLEDNPSYAEGIIESGTSVILFNQSYNKNFKHWNIKRVKGWKEILDKGLELVLQELRTIERIGISGKQGSGKSTLLETLVNDYSYKKLSFATKLKHLCMDLFGLSYEEAFGKQKNREILQDVGTKMREVRKDVWVDYLVRKIKPSAKYILDDLRYKNEYNKLKEAGFFLVRLECPEEVCKKRIGDAFKNPNHASETDLDDIEKWDLVLDTNRPKKEVLEDFKKAVNL